MAEWYQDAHAVYVRLSRDLADRLPREAIRVRNVAVGSEIGESSSGAPEDVTVLEADILRAGRRRKTIAKDADPDNAYQKLLASCAESRGS
jgi:hypothetical protein